jgi:L-alanine-DL-glutamate epimerase-like enolase superfamily enzyme
MKITGVRTLLYEYDLARPISDANDPDGRQRVTSLAVLIDTDAGITGMSLGSPSARSHIHGMVDSLLLGHDPRGVRGLWKKLVDSVFKGNNRGIVNDALSSIDVALWDLKAKDAGLPLWKLLGGGETKRLAAYNTDGGWINWSRQQLVDCARQMVAEGFPGVKIKVGSPNPYDDLDRLAAVRETIGPRIDLMVDANGRWDLPTAVRIGRRLADYDV